jgi:hypothetical protein
VENSCSAVVSDLVRLAPHTEVAHHIPGRIRLKILLSGLEMALRSKIQHLAGSLPGIRNIEVKWLSRSVIIDYDKERFPGDFWERMQRLKNEPELAGELEKMLCMESSV